MRFITLVEFAFTALLALSNCAASLSSSSCLPSVTPPIRNTTGSVLNATACDCHASATEQSVNIAALLPKTNIFKDYDFLISKTARVSEFARTAEDIHHRYFVLGSATKGWPITPSDRTYSPLQRVATELLMLSRLGNLEVLTKSAPGPLPSLQAHYAQRVIDKYKRNGNLDENRVLLFHAAELWSLAYASEKSSNPRHSFWDFEYKVPGLQKDIALALQTDVVSSLQVLRVRALLEELSELKEQTARWYPDTSGLASRMRHRADDVLTVIRRGYAHEPEPILQLMRDLVVRGGKQPVSKTEAAAGGRTPNKVWYESMSESFQQVKGFVGL
ncbi:hypothetical protein LTR27_002005 [Elasticomyces elasticus]|nr:hypothetical protein LTR27_002005 [Elasticomyces elasticus]